MGYPCAARAAEGFRSRPADPAPQFLLHKEKDKAHPQPPLEPGRKPAPTPASQGAGTAPSPLAFALGHTPALACAPNKDVADCLALILSTMKPFPPKDTIGSFSFNLLKNCGIAAKTAACGALPNGSSCPYGKDRPSAIGLDGCYSE